MQTRPLGKTGVPFTTVGFGTWAIGGGGWKFGWGAQDEEQAVQAILEAVRLGVNWIDTAAVYGNGRSEELVALALAQLPPSERPLVATKCSRVIQEDGNIIGRLKADSVQAECEASLRRLGVDVIDLYQMHWPQPEEDVEEGWNAMIDLVRQGKVRHIGVSNFSVAQMKRILPAHPIASLQPPYSMIAPEVEHERLDFCAANGIGVVVYSPMCKGLLTGLVTRERAAEFSADDHRSRDPKFADPLLGIHLDLVAGLTPIAIRNDRSLAELAIAWVLRRPEVTAAIVGARRPEQIQGTAPAGDWVLDATDLADVDRCLAEHRRALHELGNVDTGRV